MKVTIIVPPFDYGRMLYGLARRRSFHNAVPLGAVSVAAYLREAGHQVQVVDAPALDIDNHGICAEVNRFAPDAIGISATSVIWHSAVRLSRILKKRFDTPIFVGGPHPSTYPEHCLEESTVDIAVFGEGEETAVELIDRLERGESLGGIAGVAWKDGGTVRVNKGRITERKLDDAPLPAYDLLDLSRYSAPPMRVRQTPALYMELFRGCAYAKCSYCTSAGSLKNRFRRHSPEVAADKVVALNQKYGAREIAFVDDDFVVGKDWIYDFCAELRRRGKPVTWTCYLRASQVDAGVFHAMKSAGCHQVLIGMEVLDNDILRSLTKDLTVASCGEAVRAAHSAGVWVIGLFMVGVPDTDPQSVWNTVHHALAQEVDVAVFSLYRPPPGSPAFEALGWGPEEYIESFKLQKQAVYTPDAYQSLEEVEATFRAAYRNFYLHPRFMKRAAQKALSDPVLARQVLRGALTLADQFRPDLRQLLARN